MARRFVDAWLRPGDRATLERVLRACHELGYWGAALEVDEKLWREAQELGRDFGLEVFRRTTVEASSKSELYRRLGAVRWSHDLVGVATTERDVLLAAVRDMRVDTVIMTHRAAPPVDRHILQVTANCLEVALFHVFEYGFEAFRAALRAIKAAHKKKIRLIISTGAKDEYELRTPRQLASLACAASTDIGFALDAVSKFPSDSLLENRGRIEGRVSVDGVWRLAEGEEKVSSG